MSGPEGAAGHAENSVPEVWRRRILGAFFACGALLIVLDFVIHRHVAHPWERIPVFYVLFGFLGLAGLIVASKGLRRLVMRPEDYYTAVEYQQPGADGGEGAEAENRTRSDDEHPVEGGPTDAE